MTPIDFKSKKLNFKIFAGRTVNTTRAKSAAFSEIMANRKVAIVLDKRGEKAVFFNALKKEGSAGITRKKLSKVLGDIEHSGQFSSKEMRTLGRELIGGPASKRIIHVKEPVKKTITQKYVAEKHITEKPKVDMNKIIQEIRDKRRISIQPKLDIPQREESKAIDFRRSADGLRKVSSLIAKTPEKIVYDETGKADGVNDIKARLAAIQGKSNEDELDLAA